VIALGIGKLVAIGVALFVLAVGFVAVSAGQDIAALFDAFRAEPVLQKIAWLVIVLVPLVLLPAVVWLSDTLMRQRKAAQALELRLDGVRQGVKEVAKSQVDAEAAVHHLARTDPEDAITVVRQRLTEAERFAQVQHDRNEMADLQSRIDALRAQQQGLKDRLAPTLEKRRSIEQFFTALDSHQNDIERTLAEIASGDDAVALDVRLKNLAEFVRQGHERCDDIERGSKTIAGLKEDYAELGTRLDPFAAAGSGVTSLVKELRDTRDRLGGEIDALLRTPDGDLAGQVQKFANDKRRLDEGVQQLEEQFSKLATLRQDAGALFGELDRTLTVLSTERGEAGPADADAHLEELSGFIKGTAHQFDDIEQRVVVFGQLRTKLDELQSRLVPLESPSGGVVNLIDDLQQIRDRLVAKLQHIEAGESGDLAEQVKAFTETKRELEQRVSNASEHFSKLATIRKDIAGLFEKLSSAVSASSN